jgi:hypothetical protein
MSALSISLIPSILRKYVARMAFFLQISRQYIQKKILNRYCPNCQIGEEKHLEQNPKKIQYETHSHSQFFSINGHLTERAFGQKVISSTPG